MKLFLSAATAFVAASALVCPQQARAQSIPWHELNGDDPPPGWTAEPPSRSRATLSLSFRWLHHPERDSFAGGLLFTLPTQAFLPASATVRKAKEPRDGPERERTGAKRSERDAKLARPPGAPPASSPGAAPAWPPSAPPSSPGPSPSPVPLASSTPPPSAPARAGERTRGRGAAESDVANWVKIRGEDARQAVEAAERHASLARDEARLEHLASRARMSSALPQLRLRATRLVSEGASSIPTAYDPYRQTTTGGASLWLEARATWSLDRALFSEEEVRLERIERDVQGERERLHRRVLDLLFGWQDAVLDRFDPTSSFRECRRGYLREQQLAAELDFVTHGWFTRWRAERDPLPETDCFETAEPDHEANAR